MVTARHISSSACKRTLAATLAASAVALGGCTLPVVHVAVDRDPLTLVSGRQETMLVTTSAPRCSVDEGAPPLPCVDIGGGIYDFAVVGLPPGVSVQIDNSLQSGSTPGLVRLIFESAPDALPGEYALAIQARLSGRIIGSARSRLRVLAPGGDEPAPRPIFVSAGSEYSLAASIDGSVRGWGANHFGQLGLEDTTERLAPTPLPAVADVVSLSAGERHSLAATAGGTVWAWGSNSSGTLGIGTRSPWDMPLPPVQVPGLDNVVAVAAGSSHSLALKADGTVWSWGSNQNGALGLPDLVESTRPIQVPGLSGIRSIDAGASCSVAVATDGTVWFWGLELVSEGASAIRNPTPVAGLSNIRDVVIGQKAALAVDGDGAVWGWGFNLRGQLGDGTTTDQPSPVRVVTSVPNVTAVALRNYNGLALTADGSVWHWGNDVSLTPVRLDALAGVVAITAGAEHALALTSCGQIWAWGENALGQLGTSSEGNATEPVLVDRFGDDGGCDRVALRVGPTGIPAVADIVSTPAGFLPWNGADYHQTFAVGTQLTLTARLDFTLDEGHFVFDGWSGDCIGNGAGATVTLDRSKRCGLHYRNVSPSPHLLSAQAIGSGRVTSSGGGILGPEAIDCGETCDAVFPDGTVVTLTAAPAPGFGFDRWADDCAGNAAQTSVTVDRRLVCRAEFRPFQVDVTVSGGGRVTSNPAGLDCGDTCSFSPVTGTVTLQAASADGWEFDRWSGDCTGTATDAIVTVDRDKHCTANFRRVDGIFFLTMVVEGQGAVGSEPAGIACPGTCSAQFPAGTAVDLSAQAGLGWTPSFWFDDCAAPAGSTNRVIMNADKQCRIRFVPQPSFPVATFTFPGGARVGRIITFDGNASHVYDPSTLSRDFSGITSFAWDHDGDGVFAASGSRSTSAITQYAFQSNGDHNVRLRVRGGPFDDFDDDVQIVSVQDAEGPLFGLSVSKGGAGQGIVRTDPRGLIECDQSCPAAGPLLLEPGSPVVLTATPDAGSQLGGWTGCDAVTDGRCSVTMTADRAVSVTFVPASGPFTLTVAVNQPPGSFGNIVGLEPSGNAISCGGLAAQVCAQSFPAGTTVVVRPSDTSLELGLFSGWSGCDSIGPLFACTVALTGNRTVTATFAR